jgi:hypothetical protein
MRDNAVFLASPDSGHKKDARPDSGAAQRATLGRVSHPQPGRAFGFKGECAFGGAVSVAVSFYNRADGDARADVRLHNAKIFTQGAERNLSPGTAVEGERALIRQNKTFEARSIHSGDYNERAIVEC